MKKFKEETFVLNYKDGSKDLIFCKKEDIEKYITIEQYRKLINITILNKGYDKVNHRPFTIKL